MKKYISYLDNISVDTEMHENTMRRLNQKPRHFRAAYRYGGLAACLAIVLACVFVLQGLFSPNGIFNGGTKISDNAHESGTTDESKPVLGAGNLMGAFTPNHVSGKAADDAFIAAQADFAVKLLQNSREEGDNALISPLSVMLALSMTANGAAGQTLEEMERVLGNNIKIDELNEYLYKYARELTFFGELKIANSIWFRGRPDIGVKPEFLQKNADYYGAAAYAKPFDMETVAEINAWVKDKTDGLINEIINEIDPQTLMILINALSFDAEWEIPYYRNFTGSGIFNAADGTKQDVIMMDCTGTMKFLNDGSATGFIKKYKNGRYGFAALLPNEGTTLEDYVAELDGEKLLNTLKNAENNYIFTSIPKFGFEYEVDMAETALKAMGMPSAFENADFSALIDRDVYIGKVLHKAFIDVNELGTKAGAVTLVTVDECEDEATPPRVILDRPFLYAIIDNQTSLPVFIGTLNSVTG